MGKKGNVGLLVHGRHVEAVNWEGLIWGKAPNKLGSIPMMILLVLNRGIGNIGLVVFGTGASERGGIKEAQVMKNFLLENFHRLIEFKAIREHPDFEANQDALRVLAANVICEITSQNTVQEVAAAAKLFTEAGVAEVIQVTCSSHAPRCLRDAAVAAEKGLIPTSQIWSVVRDQTTYAGSQSAGDVAIMEPPHRGDDPMTKADLMPHQVFTKFFRIAGFDNKMAVLGRIQFVIEEAFI